MKKARAGKSPAQKSVEQPAVAPAPVPRLLTPFSSIIMRLRNAPIFKAAAGFVSACLKRTVAGVKFIRRAFAFPAERPALRRVLEAANRKLSPPSLTLAPLAWGVPAMILSSAAIIALETLLFHLLQIVTDYLAATSIIGMAMFGIALGGLVGFLFSRVNLLLTTVLASAGLFVSTVFSYSAVIAVNTLAFPWPLVLPFFFCSWIVSNVYASGANANILTFANSLGSGLGVIIPLFLVPVLKSETLLIVLLLFPCLLVLLAAGRTKNLILKAGLLAAAVAAVVVVVRIAADNRALPERIPVAAFEQKILPAVKRDFPEPAYADRNWEFMQTVFKKAEGVYRFTGDEADRARVETLLSYLGYRERFPIPGLTLRGGNSALAGIEAVPAPQFEGELARAFSLRFRTLIKKNPDRELLERAYKKEEDVYRLTGSGYDRLRAKHLLGELGFFPFYDLTLDLRRHGAQRDRLRSFLSNARILLSEDDLLGRIEYTGDEEEQAMALNGVYLDSIDSYNGAHWDPRVPRVGFLDKPTVYIIGLSADGIVKSAKRLAGALVAGCELHPVIMRTMTEDGWFAKLANRPYDGCEVRLGEGRSLLENDPRRWDMISLMNIHPEHGPLNTVAPENLHTVESVKALLDRLTDRGMIVYEEIVMNERSELAFRKFLNTCLAALGRTAEAERCFYVFRWDFWGDAGAFRTLVVRRTPLSDAEIRDLDVYYEACAERYQGSALMYSPARNLGTEYEKIIRGRAALRQERFPSLIPARDFQERFLGRFDDPRDGEFMLARYFWNGHSYSLKTADLPPNDRARLAGLFKRAGYHLTTDLSPVYDDRPFPYAVWEEKPEVEEIVDRSMLFALFLCLPIVVLFLHGIGARARILLPAVLFSALSGFGYMLVEIILIQRFQLFIGNPAWTMVVVLGGMLFFSGLGSLAGRFLKRRWVALASALIPVLLFGYLLFLDGWLQGLSGLDFGGKVAMTFLILFPISFLMGMPFPAALETVKKQASPAFTALLFGISGGASTVASAVALLVNVESGFLAGFSLGAILYSAGAGFFFLLLFLTRGKAAA